MGGAMGAARNGKGAPNMGAKLSDEMKCARELMRTGKTAAEAARATGLTKGAISQDRICRKYAEKAKNAKTV